MDTVPDTAPADPQPGAGRATSLAGSSLLRLRPGVVAWAVAVFLVLLLAGSESRRMRGIEPAVGRLPPNSLVRPERSTLIPDPDGMRWTVYAERAVETGHIWRLDHWTREDNFPEGREVAWSSPQMWWLVAMGELRSLTTGEPLLVAIDRAAPDSNTLQWAAASGIFCALGIAACGWPGAFTLPLLYAFLAFGKHGGGYPDHHVMIVLGTLGTAFCVLAAARHPDRSRLWMVLAGVMAGWGFWISPGSQALVEVGLLPAIMLAPRGSLRFPAHHWRYFGFTAAAIAIVTYFFEFLPHLPTHLEAPNPFYGLAMVVAGILYWQAHLWVEGGRTARAVNLRLALYPGLALFGMLTYILYDAKRWMAMADPFFARWIQQIVESLPFNIQAFVDKSPMQAVILLLIGAGLWLRWKKGGAVRLQVLLLLGMLLMPLFMTLGQERFSDQMFAVSLAGFGLCFPLRGSIGAPARWLIALACVFYVAIYLASRQTREFAYAFGTLGEAWTGANNERLDASALLDISPNRKAPVLAPPNEANYLNYFTGKPTYGTAYYENIAGIRKTLEIFYAQTTDVEGDWDAVHQQLAALRVDTIVMPGTFSAQDSYVIYGADGRIRNPQFAFFHLLQKADKFPSWLSLEKEANGTRFFKVRYSDN